MAEKIVNTRVVHKHDTALNWAKATNFTPKKGELIIYDADEEEDVLRGYYTEHPTKQVDINGTMCALEPSSSVRFKIGNDSDNVNILPFYVAEKDIEELIDNKILIVNITYENGTYKSSHTPPQIYEHTQNGGIAVARVYGYSICSLVWCNEAAADFSCWADDSTVEMVSVGERGVTLTTYLLARLDYVNQMRPLLVRYDEETNTASHTASEIYEHIHNGGTAFLYNPIEKFLYPIGVSKEELAIFSGPVTGELELFVTRVYVDNDAHIEKYETQLVCHYEFEDEAKPLLITYYGGDPLSEEYETIVATIESGRPVMIRDDSGYYYNLEVYGGDGYDIRFGAFTDDGYKNTLIVHPDSTYTTADYQINVDQLVYDNDDRLSNIEKIVTFYGDGTSLVTGGEIRVGEDADESVILSAGSIEDPSDDYEYPAQVLEFYGRRGDEGVRLRGVAPGITAQDAVTVGQLKEHLLIVSVNEGDWVANNTSTDVVKAASEGKIVFLYLEDGKTYLSLSSYGEDFAIFTDLSNDRIFRYYYLDSDGNVAFTNDVEFASKEYVDDEIVLALKAAGSPTLIVHRSDDDQDIANFNCMDIARQVESGGIAMFEEDFGGHPQYAHLVCVGDQGAIFEQRTSDTTATHYEIDAAGGITTETLDLKGEPGVGIFTTNLAIPETTTFVTNVPISRINYPAGRSPLVGDIIIDTNSQLTQVREIKKTSNVTYVNLQKLEISIKGEDGTPGSTPVKGADYFTDSDIQDIVQEVKNIMPVDNELSETSENPVQNRVIKSALQSIEDSSKLALGEMREAITSGELSTNKLNFYSSENIDIKFCNSIPWWSIVCKNQNSEALQVSSSSGSYIHGGTSTNKFTLQTDPTTTSIDISLLQSQPHMNKATMGDITLTKIDTFLCYNGDFENGTVGAVPPGWSNYKYSWGTSGSTGTLTEEDFYTGKRCMYLNIKSSHIGPYQVINVEPHKNYVIDLYYKHTSDSTVDTLFKVVAGEDASGSIELSSSSLTSTNKEWIRHTVSFNSAENNKVSIGFKQWNASSADSNLYIDNITVKDSGNLVRNGDFEAGSLTGWERFVYSWGNSSAKGTIDSTQHHSGNYSMKMRVADSHIGPYQQVAVEPNTDYVVSLWYKSTDTAGGEATLRVTAGGVSNYALGAVISTTATLSKTATTWTKATITFNSGENTLVTISTIGVYGTTSTETLYVDDIVMTKAADITEEFVPITTVIPCDAVLQGRNETGYTNFPIETNVPVDSNSTYEITFDMKMIELTTCQWQDYITFTDEDKVALVTEYCEGYENLQLGGPWVGNVIRGDHLLKVDLDIDTSSNRAFLPNVISIKYEIRNIVLEVVTSLMCNGNPVKVHTGTINSEAKSDLQRGTYSVNIDGDSLSEEKPTGISLVFIPKVIDDSQATIQSLTKIFAYGAYYENQTKFGNDYYTVTPTKDVVFEGRIRTRQLIETIIDDGCID